MMSRANFYTILSFTLAGLWTGCVRPFEEPVPPALEVVSPDLNQVFLQATISIELRPASTFREITWVEINGNAASYNPQTGHWVDTLHLNPGLNMLEILAYDRGGNEGRDTLYAVHLTYRHSSNAPPLPAARGGHTTTLLNTGDLLVLGGSPHLQAAAEGSAFLLPSGATAFTRLPFPMVAPRTEHTATRLPDGRVLILGGSRHQSLQRLDDLEELAEIYDPSSHRFSRIPVIGLPLRRARHQTIVFPLSSSEYLVFVTGGFGDSRFGETPVPLRDYRTFLFRNDSLFSLSPDPGFGFELADGHTVHPLPGSPQEYLLVGAYFGETRTWTTSLILQPSREGALFYRSTQHLPHFPRMEHAAAGIGASFVFITGGRKDTPDQPVISEEIYAPLPDQFFYFSLNGPLPQLPRWDHTATNITNTRILIIGGFNTAGQAIRGSEWFEVQSNN